ncbi:PRI2 [Lepeophtheirus salmonis]|uniref:PRI2 n=2 Tax=Lepeophtheirus salmonis TaxID=72036 RepID=A0A7R8H833_LEPSM|nr:PRI2 [Lepeophtheirus salmonis]CAF2934548.1 PRI2 [Lepeophtheirus salmonis]
MNYSKESKSSGCNHSWQKDQRKLLYSIRHSYGLEGNKINYSAHSCSSIQKNSYKGPNEQLICPFTNQGNGFAHPDIEDLVQSRQPSKACERYFAHLKQSHVQTTLLKPSDYFFSSFNIEKES